MSEVGYKGRLDYSKFDKMDTDILEALLRANFDAPEAERIEPEAVLYILNLLSERQEDESLPTETEIAASKAEFDEKYYPMLEDEQLLQDFLEDMEYAEESEDNAAPVKPWLRRWRRFASVAAVLVLFMFVGTVTAYALGYNPVKFIGRWNDEQFWFEPVYVTTELSDKVAEYAGEIKLVPEWLPDGYVSDTIIVSEPNESSFGSIHAVFYRELGNVKDTLDIHYRFPLKEKDTPLYEKDTTPVEEYVIYDTKYYIMENLTTRSIVWRKGAYECSINGTFSLADAKKIINSIYGE